MPGSGDLVFFFFFGVDGRRDLLLLTLEKQETRGDMTKAFEFLSLH